MSKKRGRKAKKIRMSRIVKTLIFSDVVAVTGWGLLWPIFAIFLREDISGTLMQIGIASAIFVVVRCAAQLPIAKFVDKHTHKANLLILGSVLVTIVPLLYIGAKSIQHIYAIQALHGLAAAFLNPTFLSLFSTHLSKKHEGFEWSIYSTYTGIVIAATAFAGAWIATEFGFNILFLIVAGFSFIRTLIICSLEKKEIKAIGNKSKEKFISIFMGHRKEPGKPSIRQRY